MSTKNEGCKLCNQKPKFSEKLDTHSEYLFRYVKEYDQYASSKQMTDDCFADVYIGADREGKIIIWASGECESTSWYYPNYCPECGRKLKND